MQPCCSQLSDNSAFIMAFQRLTNEHMGPTSIKPFTIAQLDTIRGLYGSSLRLAGTVGQRQKHTLFWAGYAELTTKEETVVQNGQAVIREQTW
jgi:hypothetical protein